VLPAVRGAARAPPPHTVLETLVRDGIGERNRRNAHAIRLDVSMTAVLLVDRSLDPELAWLLPMAPGSLKAVIVLTLLPWSAALADPPPAGPPTARSTPRSPTTPPASSEPTAPVEPDIATPAPDAPPSKVEEAKEVAKEAALTPIIPNPKDVTRPAFQLYAEIDVPILAVGAVFVLARRTKTEPAFCAPACDSVGLNRLDRVTAGYYSSRWSRLSDFLLYGIGASAAGLLLKDEGWLSALNDGVVILESTMSASSVSSIMTLAAGRPRPFLYGDADNPDGFRAPLSVRNSANASLSFLSGHTTQAFAITTSLYIAQRRLHPGSRRPLIQLGAGLTVASLVALSRVMAGYHFITDVVGGAVVGSSIGVLVASVHGSPVEVVPVVSETPAGRQAGLEIRGSF
jgi:membrane-associated phospholipid phosphatase